jgi:hypothetical protein
MVGRGYSWTASSARRQLPLARGSGLGVDREGQFLDVPITLARWSPARRVRPQCRSRHCHRFSLSPIKSFFGEQIGELSGEGHAATSGSWRLSRIRGPHDCRLRGRSERSGRGGPGVRGLASREHRRAGSGGGTLERARSKAAARARPGLAERLCPGLPGAPGAGLPPAAPALVPEQVV